MSTRSRSPRTEGEETTISFSLRLTLALLSALPLLPSCHRCTHPQAPDTTELVAARNDLVRQLRAAEIHDETVLAAIGRIPRDAFVRPRDRHRAYDDHALPIDAGQTISQPYIVARMTELLEVGPGARVLEVGTGSGYQAAVLASIVHEVFSIEIVPELAARARRRLQRLGYENVSVRTGDGFYGWPEAAPFDAAIITAAAPQVPPAIVAQLVEHGRLVMPLDTAAGQVLVRGRKRGTELVLEEIAGVLFVPMIGDVRR